MNVIDNEGVHCVAVPKCAQCGGNGRIIHRRVRDELFGAPGVWNVKRCLKPDCGLAWLDPQPLPEDAARIPPAAEEDDERNAAIEDESAVRDRLVSTGMVALAKRLLRGTVRWRRFWFDTDYVYLGSGAPGRVLDVGCGDGGYLAAVQAQGWTGAGLDRDAAKVAAARARGLDATVGEFLDNGFEAGSFNAVTMRNIIQTLPDPTIVFAEAFRLLRPGGRLIVMTPNIESYGHSIYGPDWRGLGVPRHRYIYSAQMLVRLAKRAGFARWEAFSQLRNERGVRYMAHQSEAIAARTGRVHHAQSAAYLGRKAALRAWLGIARGEWVHLVAEKPAGR